MSIQESCEWFHVVDWDEATDEIIHAICADNNPTWPNCNSCKGFSEYREEPEEEKDLNQFTLLHEL